MTREDPNDACANGCIFARRHLRDCPVEDYATAAWTPAQLDPMETALLGNGDARTTQPALADLCRVAHLNRRGQIETLHRCRGCLPRPVMYGVVCEQCHLRLTEWLNGHTEDGRWILQIGSLAWAYDWLAADREPRQTAAGLDKIMQGKKVPPAALALHIYDLRSDIEAALGRWLRDLTAEHDLTGPAWWAYRVEHRRDVPESWRAWRPQNQAEVTDAQRFLAAWLPRLEQNPELVVPIRRDAEDLIVRVASIAPWRAEPRRLPGIPCPECNIAALAIYDGDDHVTCNRCTARITRQRYDIWSEMLIHEKQQAS